MIHQSIQNMYNSLNTSEHNYIYIYIYVDVDVDIRESLR